MLHRRKGFDQRAMEVMLGYSALLGKDAAIGDRAADGGLGGEYAWRLLDRSPLLAGTEQLAHRATPRCPAARLGAGSGPY